MQVFPDQRKFKTQILEATWEVWLAIWSKMKRIYNTFFRIILGNLNMVKMLSSGHLLTFDKTIVIYTGEIPWVYNMHAKVIRNGVILHANTFHIFVCIHI